MRSSSFRTIATLIAVPLAGMAIFFFWQWINDGITPPEVAREIPRAIRKPVRATPAGETGIAPAPEDDPTAESKPRRRPPRSSAPPPGPVDGAIVLIIDDLGFEGQPLDRIMALDPDVSFSILPNGTRTAEFAARLHARGFEILCHLPMEPRGKERPGRNAVLTSMSDEEIARVTAESVAAIPNARGVNNHMGSLATADRRVMASVLGAIPDGMYFIDSRTSGKSVAEAVAKELRVPTAARHVFLDDVATESFVRKQLAELVSIAGRRGVAIGIGHPYPATMRVLEQELPALRASGLRVVRASEVVR